MFLLTTNSILTDAPIVYQALCEGLSHILSQSSPWTSDEGFITPFLQMSGVQTAGEWWSQDAVSDLSIPQTSAFHHVLLASTIILGSTVLTGDSPAPPSAIILQISSRKIIPIFIRAVIFHIWHPVSVVEYFLQVLMNHC